MANFVHNLNVFRVKHEPEILMSVGLAGLVFSVAWGVRATVKAVKVCEEKKKAENKDKLTKKEIIKATWKYYLPVAVTTCASIPCIIASNRVSSRRNAALAAAYTLSEAALQEYQNKAKEIVGEKKEKEIREAVDKELVEKSKGPSKELVMLDDSEQLFYEPLTDRYFKSTWNKIQQACNELNEEAIGSTTGIFTLNDWFYRIGLDYTEIGDNIGWCTPVFGNSEGLLKISMTTTVTKDNKPCGCIHYEVRPYKIG